MFTSTENIENKIKSKISAGRRERWKEEPHVNVGTKERN